MERAEFERLTAMAGPMRRLLPGAHLFERGELVERLWLVASGEVVLCRFDAGGKQAILQRATAGDILAEASVFSERYHCAAVAQTATELRPVPMAQLRRELERDAGLAAALLQHMGRELRQARMRAEILSLRTVAARLTAWSEWQGGALPARGNWRSLADELGVSPEALYREMARRRSKGGRA